MGVVYKAPTEHYQAPQKVHYETQRERSDMAPKEPQDSIYRDRLPW